MGIISSLIGGIFGSANTKSTNKTNAQIAADTNATNRAIAQETNAANAALAQQQNEWNLEQWNRENEYNSPANQVALLEQAGLNGLGYDTSSSTSSHLESAQLANQQVGSPMVGATMQPTDYSWLTDLSQNMANVSKTNAETENIHQNTKLGQQLYAFNEENFGLLLDEKQLSNNAQRMANDMTRDTSWSLRGSAHAYMKDYYNTQKSVLRFTREQSDEGVKYVKDMLSAKFDEVQKNLTLLDQAIKGNEVNLDWLPKEKALEYTQRLANLQQTYAQTGYIGAQTANVNASTTGIMQDNTIRGAEMSDSIEKFKSDVKADLINNLAGDDSVMQAWLRNPTNYNNLQGALKHIDKHGRATSAMTSDEKEAYNKFVKHTKAQSGFGSAMRETGKNMGWLIPFGSMAK